MPTPRRQSTNRGALDVQALQPVDRDFAFVVADAVSAADLVSAAIGANKKLVAAASIFDVFSGGALEEGTKSIAVRVSLQPTDRTLTEDDIDAVATQIIVAVNKSTGATLRGA